MRGRSTTERFRRKAPGLAAVITILFLACAESRGDTIMLKDGSRRDGKILSERESSIVVETRVNGIALKRTIPKSQIESIAYDLKTGPAYCALPIIGTIGKIPNGGQYVCAKAFARSLDQARAAKAEYIVLVIDSQGGAVAEMEEIIAAIRKANDVKFIAYVHEALSAAAVIAMACPSIYMAPDSRIGAAVPYHLAPDGTPQNIDEKMQSAIRAAFRSATELGGHDPLLMRGMMEPEIVLALASEPNSGGAPMVVEASPAAPAPPPEKIIKPVGRILTLTGSESVSCGLAAAVCDSIDLVGSKLGHESWHEADDRPWHAMLNASKCEQIRAKGEAIQREQAAAREQEIKRIRAEIAQLNGQITAARARVTAAHNAIVSFHEQIRRELEIAKSNFEREQDKARRLPDPRPHLVHVKDVYTANEAAILERERSQTLTLEKELDAARTEEKRLFGQQVRLQKSVPAN
ncbi:MAG: hypothetical protein L0Y44_02025 [Phycisphaerales bacterium]|nr:hypothetical protein [Phycisphaerales bacterium]MCI0629415.1 hypothetical protein [Phycisphaerales bacterium]MCI0675230.1 hypothetical protein [Phycisphaerales bacterium]